MSWATLKVDEKWSVDYDPHDNDRPVAVRRHGEVTSIIPSESNFLVAMFYALKEARDK